MADVFAVTGTTYGEINALGDDLALHLKVFSGEVLAEMRARLLTEGRVRRKDIPLGAKSTQFRTIGNGLVKRHVAGKNLITDDALDATKYMQKIPQGEIECFLDRPLTETTFTDKWDKDRSVFSDHTDLAMELAKDIAVRIDTERFLLMIKAASGALSATYKNKLSTGFPQEGEVFTDANFATDPAALLQGIRNIRKWYMEADIDWKGDAYVALPPEQYLLLVENTDLLNRDFGGENGLYSMGEVWYAWGIRLLDTTNVPTGTFVGDLEMTTGVNGETYDVDASDTVGISWVGKGFGAAEAEAIGVESEYKFEMKGYPIVASAVVGNEIIRPDHFVQLKTS